MSTKSIKHPYSERFRGFYPVVVDIETAGFDAKKDAVLELAAVLTTMDEDGNLQVAETLHYHIEPFPGANLEKSSLDFNGIKPFNPFRMAISEKTALTDMYKAIREKLKKYDCTRAVMVAHNATFDHGFYRSAAERAGLKKDPFHQFTTFDTATLAGLVYGQTVLSRAVEAAGLVYDESEAHSAKYDAEITADLFCKMVNKVKALRP
tara:strand:+ start:44436 stop:45056 length:621 start_codon:yes stop_codon:yes gene_type:complete